MSGQLVLTVQEAGQRLDKWLAEHLPDKTRSGIQKLIEEGRVTANGQPLAKSAKLSPGEQIVIDLPEPKALAVAAEPIPLNVVFEDGDLLVVEKPKGMVVHPAAGNETGTLVNALLWHCGDSLSGINGVMRPGIVHRIDKDTSGLLVVAKNDFAHVRLAEQIKAHSVTREYRAVVYGNLREDSGRIDLPIGRHPTERKKMAVLVDPHRGTVRSAVTCFQVIRRYRGFTQVALRLETGRTHQIRVHMAYIGHPVAGDPVYGPKKVIASLKGQCLHAGLLGFVHPRTGEYMEFSAALPPYFTDFLNTLPEI